MEFLKLNIHIAEDGSVVLTLPPRFANQSYEALLVLKSTQPEEVDAMGYPIGYFERTYGSFADDPLERGEQLPISPRENWESE